MLRKIWNWSRQHLLLVTLLCIACIGILTFVNIEILHMTSEPEFCAMCHPKKGFGPLAEVDSWEHSGHGEAGVSCLDCHGRPGVDGYVMAKMGGLKDLYMQFTISAEEKHEILSDPDESLVPSETCLFCHSDEGNSSYRENHPYPIKLVGMRLSDDVVNPDFRLRKGLPDIMTETSVGGTHFDHALHIEGMELTCADCHFGVVHRKQSKTDRMNRCLVCHAENVGSSAPQLQDCTVCHEGQLAMNQGKGALDPAGEGSPMYTAGIDCQMCHTAVTKGVYRPSAATCTDCHDEGYREIFEGWSLETKEEIKRINGLKVETEEALRRADRSGRDTEAGWRLFQKALANLNFVKDDGTNGVHNRFYAKTILESAKTDLEEVESLLNSKW